jgi:hypothetical protein
MFPLVDLDEIFRDGDSTFENVRIFRMEVYPIALRIVAEKTEIEKPVLKKIGRKTFFQFSKIPENCTDDSPNTV